MPTCSFCGQEFETSEELGEHMEKEHRSQAEDEMSSRIRKKTLVIKYSLTAIIVIGASLIIPQVLSEAPSALGEAGSDLNLSQDPILGDEEANVSVIMFGDYKCSTCADLNDFLVNEINDDYIRSGKVKLYFINYDYLSVDGGGSSTRTAVASECMLQQNRDEFWNFHNSIYSNQGAITEDWATEDFLVELARKSTNKTNYTRLTECISSEETLEEVNNDKSTGIKLNVGQTPTVFVNGRKVMNPTRENIRKEIEAAISQNESEGDN